MLRFLAASIGFVLALAVAVWPAVAADKAGKASSTPSPADDAAREEVHQALLAETVGNNEERSRRLMKALEIAPEFPEANWHLARIKANGAWLPVAEAMERADSNAEVQKYRELRAKAVNNLKPLRDLA